ncbi:RHS repeat protein [Streptomyces koyangensis]|uniref:RHS repeat protein n=1 Tax=Streptomyces koyangensis TaxID=188770 RepID=A0ABX7EP17_9ACTN|nr:RHS repeat protein [Streptomyces koyangensis]
MALSLIGYLIAGLLGAPVAAAAELALRDLDKPKPVPVSPVEPQRFAAADEAAKNPWKPDADAAWPSPGSTIATVAEAQSKASAKRAGSLPVRASAAKGKAAADQVQVQVLGQESARTAGVDGVLLAVRALGSASAPDDAPLDIELDYRGFAGMYGGDWASRLTVREVPACALTSSGRQGCAPSAAVESVNDSEAGKLTATLVAPVAATPTPTTDPVASPSLFATAQATPVVAPETRLLAVTAAASGATGDFTQTSLSPSGSWEAGGSSGGFSWSYELATPPVPGEFGPDLGLSYSSQAVDGRTAATNNQANWIGDGWTMEPGYIERRYTSCEDDKKDGNNPSGKVGDQCWKKENATLSLGGSSTPLVKDDTSGEWRKKNDDGTRIALLTSSNRGNGDNNGEYWRVTAPDGTRYYFGYHRLPGWAEGKPETNSTWTVPVYGNHDGEPCHATAFKDSWCQQAWRWNLDYVVDPHSNAMAYYWTKETNHYQRNIDPATYKGTMTPYTRGGHLDRIEYGLRSNTMYGRKAAAKVDFTVAERCLPTEDFDCAAAKFTAANAKKWPDTPFDQYCTASAACEGNSSPSFFTRKRLTQVTTSALSDGAYQPVDTWKLTHSFPATGDGTDPALWLASLTRTGHAGGKDISLPAVTFRAKQLPNRVEGAVDEVPPYNRYRVQAIDTESGSTIAVTYSEADCKPGSLPTPSSNTKRCYPVIWSPPESPGVDYEPYQDWFHSYVVTQMLESDNTGGAPVKRTDYRYLGGLAWAKGDDEFTKAKHRTYGDRRGYERVQVRGGDPAQTEQSLTETRYFRGIAGAKVADGEGKEIADHEAFAGMTREFATYDGDGGSLLTATSSTPWRSAATATHSRKADGLPDVQAFHTGTSAEQSRGATTGGKLRRTETALTFDSLGRVVTASETGDTAVTGDESCTTTRYTPSEEKNLLGLVAESTVVAKPCGTTPKLPADLISQDRYYYDGATSLTADATKGDETRREEQNGAGTGFVTTNTAEYDQYGRQTKATDASGATTTVAYTPATGQAPTSTTSTNALGHATTTHTDVLRGLATAVVDANGKRSDAEHDALGRVIKVWDSGWTKAAHANAPLAEYTYAVSKTKPTVITAKSLNYQAGYDTSYTFYDGMLRPRETQQKPVGTSTGVIVSETLYDTKGRAWRSYDPYYVAGSPSTTLITGDDTKVPAATELRFDGADRQVAALSVKFGDETRRTTTVHDGDTTTVLPPKGGTATTTLVDALGRVVEKRAYTDEARTAHQSTTYTYDHRGNLAAMTGPDGTEWGWEYDARGREITADDPDKGISRTTYDDADRPVTTTDARGTTLTTSYDALGRPTALKQGSTIRAAWTYDTVAKGQPASDTRYLDGEPWTNSVTAYNDRYQPTATTTVIPSTAKGVTGTYSWTHGYNQYIGLPEWTLNPAIGNVPRERVTTVYTAGNLPNVLTAGSVTLVNKTSYDFFARPVRVELGNLGQRVYDTRVYDEHTGELTRRTVDGDIALRIQDTRYGYDDAGNTKRISSTEGQDAAAVTDTQCFAIDALGRLTDAYTAKNADDTCAKAPTAATVGGPDSYWHSYSYDATGNRTQEVQHPTGGASGQVTRAFATDADAAEQPHAIRSVTTTGGTAAGTESFTYDKAGNTTSRTGGPRPQEYTWDAEGHLATVTENGKKTEYAYDSAGQRILAANADGSTTAYLPGGNELKVSASGTATAQRYYTHNGETIATRDGKGFTYLFPDHQGTAMLAVTWGAGQLITRRKQLPFGAPRATTGTDWPGDRGFVGGTTDPTGYTHLGAREYDPTLGRFLSVDPLLLTDDPTQHNPYTYANNNPVTYADPTGEAYEECGKVITCGKGGVPHKPKKPNTAVSGGNPGSPGNSGSYVPWTPGSKKRIKADPSKGRYNSYGHLGHNSYGQTTYAAQEEYARAAAAEAMRDSIAESKARQKKNQQEAGFWSGVGDAWNAARNWVGSNWEDIKTYSTLVGFGVCVVASAGVCIAVGAGIAGAKAVGDRMGTGEWDVRALAKDLAWTAAGGGFAGAFGRSFGGASTWGKAYGTNAIARSPKVYRTKVPGARGVGGGRKSYKATEDSKGPVDWGATYGNMSINAGFNTVFCGSGDASLGSYPGVC